LQSERYDKDKRNLEKDEAGNIIYRQGYAGDYNNPSRWSSGSGSSSEDFGSSRGRGRGGRGDGGRGRQQQFQQQEQYQEAARGSYGDYGQSGGYVDRYDSGGRGRGRGRQQQQQRQEWQQQQPGDGGWFGGGAAGGRDDSVRQDQMDWMGEMGSGRYSDDEGGNAAPSGYNAAGRDGKEIGGRDDSWRQQQMSYMEEMGSGRYSNGSGLSGSGDEWRPPPARRGTAGGAAGAAPAGLGVGKAFGGTGDAVRRGQMSYMEDMGSGRYSDDEGPDAGREAGRAGGVWGAARGSGGGKDESVRERQMDFMGEMGSGRYSDMDDSGDEYQPPPRAPRGQKQQPQQQQQKWQQDPQKGSLMSEFAGAFEGLEANSSMFTFGSGDSFGSGLDSPSSSSGATQRNNGERGKGGPAAAGPGKASYMDEGSFGWGEGDASGDFDSEGPAAAKHLHDEWKQDSGQDVWTGFDGASFDDPIAAAAGDDPLLQQLASMPDNAGKQSQRQQRQAPSSRQQQQQQQQRQPGARGGRRGGRASRGAGGRAATAGDWKLAADGADDADGFEDGWTDRMMSDGNDQVGLDDVMNS
jgi:hypothetical protein